MVRRNDYPISCEDPIQRRNAHRWRGHDQSMHFCNASRGGHYPNKLVRAPEEMDKASKKAVDYRPPGR
jgi:hypothetical protein